jgi:hypothetical protein
VDSLNHVIVIVPRLPPSIDGVGDYALNIALQLRKDFNIQTHFIVGDLNWTGDAKIEGFTVSQVNNLSSDALISTLSDLDRVEQGNTPILLHYVGYGYALRGCPNWLVNGLQRWKDLHPEQSLTTMFHEISASGPIWTSTFWLSPLQRQLAGRLTRMSDHCITSKQLYADILIDISRGKHSQVLSLPVFSNVGEPTLMPVCLSDRERRVIIFGGTVNRAKVYQQSHHILLDICQKLDIQEIYDIGNPTGITPELIGTIPIVEAGKLPGDQISAILSQSLVGFFDYDADYLAKSTIFAAYCAHRLLPISAKGNFLPIDGVEAGKHYWAPESSELIKQADIQLIADNAYAWYQTHNLSIQSQLFNNYLNIGEIIS